MMASPAYIDESESVEFSSAEESEILWKCVSSLIEYGRLLNPELQDELDEIKGTE